MAIHLTDADPIARQGSNPMTRGRLANLARRAILPIGVGFVARHRGAASRGCEKSRRRQHLVETSGEGYVLGEGPGRLDRRPEKKIWTSSRLSAPPAQSDYP